MAIDNLKGGTKRGLGENNLDNLRGGTKRVYEENSINNLRGGTKRVILVGGGSAPVIDELNVTPSTSAQTITAPAGTDGYSPVNVSAVDATIDANITAGNIKKDVQILGVTGSYEGTTPTGTMYIISNGTYNVADKAIADVQVPTTAPSMYLQYDVVSGVLDKSTASPVMNFAGVTEIAPYGLTWAYARNQTVGAVDLSDLITLNIYCLYRAFYQSSITSLDLSGLTTIPAYNGGTGQYCLAEICSGCSNLVSVDLSNVTTIGAQSASTNGGTVGMFAFTGLKILSFTSLTSIGATALPMIIQGCSDISIYFPAVTSSSFVNNSLRYMCLGATNVTLHFPSSAQTRVEALTDYSTTTPFGATSGTVLFDLPATE